MNLPSIKDAENALNGLNHLSTCLTTFLQSQKPEPLPGSIAGNELLSFAEPDLALHTHTCGLMSLESAFEHLVAYLHCYTSPTTPFASFTCARGLLESAAVAVWLLDHRIDVKERVGRHFAFRYEGLQQQGKMNHDSKKQPDKVAAKLEKMEEQAKALGFPPLQGKKGRSGIGLPWPGSTELIRKMLGPEQSTNYRILSSVAHGHHWALTQVGYIMENSNGTITATKRVSPVFITRTASSAARAITDASICRWKLFGLNMSELAEFLKASYDIAGFGETARTWR